MGLKNSYTRDAVEHMVLRDLNRFRPSLLNKIPVRSTWVSGWIRHAIFSALYRNQSKGESKSLLDRTCVSRCREAFVDLCHSCGRSAERVWGDARYLICISFDIDSLWSIRTGKLFRVASALSRRGIYSTFYVVGLDYEHDHDLYDALREMGHEIGLHGIHHSYDGPFVPSRTLTKQFDRLNDLLWRHRIVGYRAPCYLKSVALFEEIVKRFEYDSSFRSVARSVWTEDGWEGEGFIAPFSYKGLVCLPCTGYDDLEIRAKRGWGADISQDFFTTLEPIREVGGIYTQVLHLEAYAGVDATLESLLRLQDKVSENGEGCFITCGTAVHRAKTLGLVLGEDTDMRRASANRSLGE